MDKDKILEKARKEHKGKDLIEKEVIRESGHYVEIVTSIVAVILILMQIVANVDSKPVMVMALAMSGAKSYARFKVTQDERNFWSALISFGVVLLLFYIYAKDLGLL